MNKQVPAEGVYVLASDVENPSADRRSRDFRKRLVYSKGTRLLVKHDTFEHEVVGRKIVHVVANIYPMNGWFHQAVHHNHDAYETLVAAMIRVETTDKEWMELEGIGAESALLGLIESGKVTREEAKAAYCAHVDQEVKRENGGK